MRFYPRERFHRQEEQMGIKADKIGALLQRERQRHGLTVRQVAADAEIATNHLAEIEIGFRDGRGLGPSVEVLERVAQRYGLQVWLIPAEEDVPN
jgi:transcriptional regulator with XRE-family HTH domain